MPDTQYGFRGMPKVDQSRFAIVPAPGVERSVFSLGTAHKTTFDAGKLIPVYYTEVLPGDSYKVQMTALARMATPVFPIMDNLYLDSFFFFVPYRLLWSNWNKFMGEHTPDPTSSIDFLVPQLSLSSGAVTLGSLGDYFGIPFAGIPGTFNVSVLPFRAYNLIWNEWFRDENLQSKAFESVSDSGGAGLTNYPVRRRGKRYDYFTSALVSAQKGAPVNLPFLGATAPVKTHSAAQVTGAQQALQFLDTTGATPVSSGLYMNAGVGVDSSIGGVAGTGVYPSNLYADLTTAASATINTLRTAVALQQFLERDARGGTRYTEIIRSHFGVLSPDARLQRPEYLGGGSTPVTINPVAQTSQTGTTPLGHLAGVGMGVAQHGFSGSFTEHGIIIGLVCVRADLTYQQGLERFWSRRTRHDFFWPDYAYLGEQEVLRKEIYTRGTADDDLVFGYQERFAEYRFHPSKITGKFRSGVTGTLDAWHLAQNFSGPPVLGPSFIEENPPMSRVLAGGVLTNDQQFLFDSVFQVRAVRPIPMYGTPGLMRF